MDNIDLILDLKISRQVGGITTAGLNIACLLATTVALSSFGAGITKLYSDASSVAKDFGSSSAVAKAATAYFAQNPASSKLRVATRGTAVAPVHEILFTGPLVTGNKVNGYVNGYELSETEFDTSSSETLSDIAGKIALINGIASAVVGTNKITVTASANYSLDLTGFVVTEGTSRPDVSIDITTEGYSIVDDINNAIADKNDWYALLSVSTNQGDIISAARRLNSEIKIGTFLSDSSAIKTTSTTDIASICKNAGFSRSSITYHQSRNEFLDSAWTSQQLAENPGQSVWALKTLEGITVSPLNSSEIANIQDKNCNVYVEVGGSGTTSKGVMMNGVPIEVTRDIDYVQLKIQEDFVSFFKKTKKVPYTQAGVDKTISVLDFVLKRMVNQGILATYTITKPKLTDISTNDKANNILPDVYFEAVLAGSLKKVIIRGVVTD